jgi:uncharacterized membrane protein YbhN (UPF0104 family)
VIAIGFTSWLQSLQQIKHPDPLCLSLALVAEIASLLAYALVVRGLLGILGITARTRVLLRATVGGIAMGASLPGGRCREGRRLPGPVVSPVRAVRRRACLRRVGAHRA